MNKSTASKIRLASDRLQFIHQNIKSYQVVIPLLDEPYQLALSVMDFDEEEDPREVAKVLGLNWQTVVQIRRALAG
ncbi:MAG: hypothetical protein KME06_09520 [Kastovskya adunca ATA6-11-RM4]|jgi:hypothetical protein|nr:hypothetical protein [Kastovskya adunca ATA6-11-RM4]